MLVDSHCHLNYLEDPEAALGRARAAGVGTMLCIGVNAAGQADVLALAERHADVWATAGLHPEAAAESVDWIQPWLRHPRVVAVGETGLDYFHAKAPAERTRQCAAFESQLALAAAEQLPVVVHTRMAEDDTLALLRQFPGVRGVLHCFTERWEMADAALALGYYISISGIVTFRNGDNVRAVAARIPADRLLVETDSPWLAPVPHRGKTNEPAFVAQVAERVAEVRGCDSQALAEQTRDNFFRLFQRAAVQSSSSSNSR